MLKCSNITLQQGDFSLNAHFEVPEGKMLSLLGSSGAGKSTILHCIAGFRTPDSGDILYKEKSILSTPANKRNVRLVFQDYALFSHMNAYQNIAYGLYIKHYPKTEIEKQVYEIMNTLHIYKYRNASIETLSGGEQQRVALARAIVSKPDILLLDEPLSALDVSLRSECRKEIRNIQQAKNLTSIYVTHDQAEAFAISDYIAIINNGHIEQIGTPKDLYNNPANIFVAKFLGECNTLQGTIIDERNNEYIIQTNIGIIKKTKTQHKTHSKTTPAFALKDKVMLCIRPEHIQLASTKKTLNTYKGTIIKEEFRGAYSSITLRINTEHIIMNIPNHITNHITNHIANHIANHIDSTHKEQCIQIIPDAQFPMYSL